MSMINLNSTSFLDGEGVINKHNIQNTSESRVENVDRDSTSISLREMIFEQEMDRNDVTPIVYKPTLSVSESRYEIDDDLNRVVVSILNSGTKELIRQIPSKESLELSKRISEAIKNLYN